MEYMLLSHSVIRACRRCFNLRMIRNSNSSAHFVLRNLLYILIISDVFPRLLSVAVTEDSDVLEGKWSMGRLWFKTDKVTLFATNFGYMRLYAMLKKKGSYLGVGVRLLDNWRIWQYYDDNSLFLMFSVGDTLSPDLFIESSSLRVFLGDRLPPPTRNSNGFPVSSSDPRLFVMERAIKFAYGGYVLKHVASARYLSSRRLWRGASQIILTYRKLDCLVWRFLQWLWVE